MGECCLKRAGRWERAEKSLLFPGEGYLGDGGGRWEKRGWEVGEGCLKRGGRWDRGTWEMGDEGTGEGDPLTPSYRLVLFICTFIISRL